MFKLINYLFKRKTNEEVVYKRDSFDCRITDYSCEILLSHLSFEDKIKFECISKQFKQLVFNKQKGLTDGMRDRNDSLPQLWSDPSRNESFEVKPNLIAFESLLKKCKSINTFRFKVINNEMMKLLTKHCNELKALYADLCQIDIEVVNSFGQKFGQSLQTIGFNYLSKHYVDQNLEKSLIKLCPNLIAIKGIQFNHFIDSNDFIHFEKLTELSIKIKYESDMNLFDIFVDKYKTQLKSLSITYSVDNQIDQIFGNQLIKFFQSIAKELTQLTEFNFILKFRNKLEINEHILHKILIIISQMVNIQKFGLQLNDQTIPAILTTFHLMKDLTSLTLTFVKLTDESFTDIHKHFPKLQTLKIFNTFGLNLNRNSLRSLSKLENLTTVQIIGGPNDLDLKDEDMIQFITECKNIQHLNIISKRNLSIKTIETIVSLALSQPQNKFSFGFNFGENLQQFEKKLPKNLRIHRFEIPFYCALSL